MDTKKLLIISVLLLFLMGLSYILYKTVKTDVSAPTTTEPTSAPTTTEPTSAPLARVPTGSNTGNYVVTASSSGFGTRRAFDNDVTTQFQTLHNNGYYTNKIFNSNITDPLTNTSGYRGEFIQIKAPSPILVDQFSITPFKGSDGIYGAPVDFKFFGSNDNTTWTELYNSVGEQWTEDTKFFKFNNNTPYSTYRLVVNKVNNKNNIAISEMQLYGN